MVAVPLVRAGGDASATGLGNFLAAIGITGSERRVREPFDRRKIGRRVRSKAEAADRAEMREGLSQGFG